MYTPHPSLVPIEMASAGMLTVTNTFENKTAEAMAAISPNLIAAEPAVEAIAAALVRRGGAASRTSSAASRGSAVRWSRDWDHSFDDALLDARDRVPGDVTATAASPRAPSPAVAPPPGNPRFALFDSLRAIAVLAVLIFHVVAASPARIGGA